MSLILEKYFVVFEYFQASLKVIERLWNFHYWTTDYIKHSRIKINNVIEQNNVQICSILILSRLLGHMYPTTGLNKTNGNAVSRKQCNFASFRLLATTDDLGGKMDHVSCVIVALISSFIRRLPEWLPCCAQFVAVLAFFVETLSSKSTVAAQRCLENPFADKHAAFIHCIGKLPNACSYFLLLGHICPTRLSWRVLMVLSVPTGCYDLYCMRTEYLFFMILKLGCMQARSQKFWWGEGKQHPSLNIELFNARCLCKHYP